MPLFRRQEPTRERTQEDREAARLEREARRRGDTPRTPAAIRRAESLDDAAPPAPYDEAAETPLFADPAAPHGDAAFADAPPTEAHAADPPTEARFVDPQADGPHVADGPFADAPPAADAPPDTAADLRTGDVVDGRDDDVRFADEVVAPREDDVRFADEVVAPRDEDEVRFMDDAVAPRAEDLRFADAPADPRDDDLRFADAPADPRAEDLRFADAPAGDDSDPRAGGVEELPQPHGAVVLPPADEPPTAVHDATEAPAPDPANDLPPTEAHGSVALPPVGHAPHVDGSRPDEGVEHPLDQLAPPTESWPAPAPPAGTGDREPAGPPTEVWAPAGAGHRPDELPPDEPPAEHEPWSAWAEEPAPVVPPAEARANRFGDEDERPVPLRRPGARRSLPPTPPAPGGGGRPPRRPKRTGPGGGGGGEDGDGTPRRRRRLAPALLLALAALVALLAAGAYVVAGIYQPFGTDNSGRVRVEVPQNATAAEISDLLAEEGVVSSSFFFDLRARLDGARESFRAGTYTLRRDMPYDEAIRALTVGPAPARTINVTVPEGRSRRETAPLVEQAGLRGDYLRASRRPTEGFSLRRYGAPSGNGLEGFLFPATYELRPRASARTLVARQLEAFEENFARVDLSRARSRNLSRYDVLIIASMIEREATLARERRLMSAVISNRLRQGIPLGIDATTRYETNNWERPIRQSELEADTPYNTRINQGLPPGPIGNPGLASMRAAANPANSDVLYYVARICGEGAHDFSSSDAEFQRDVARYNAERERRGGRAPTNC